MNKNSIIVKVWTAVFFTLIYVATAGFAAPHRNKPPVVTNVIAEQLDDGDGLVKITYDVADEEGDWLSVMVEVSSDGGATYLVPMRMENLRGDIGNSIPPGRGKKIIWDAPKDQPNVNSASYRARITAVEQPAGMILIPAGHFIMGNNNGKVNAQPERPVYLDTFFIDQHEVTNAEFSEFLNAIGQDKDVVGNQLIDLEDSDVRVRFVRERYRTVSGFGDHPVTEVTWYGAKAYAEWRDKRLPTEAEWEKAARGIDGHTYPWGESTDDIWAKTNYNNNIGSTERVGRYTEGRSPYGVYDMAGSVWEWVADGYISDFYRLNPDRNPFNEVTDTDVDVDRVVRGGSWFNTSDKLHCAYRSHQAPTDSGHSIGFRCAISIHQ